MKKLLLIRYGEISLKGLNRNYFINTLVQNIKYTLRDFRDIKISKISGRITISDFEDQYEDEIINRVKKVFGIVYITKAFEVESDIDMIKATALDVMRFKENVTFKVEARRSDKNFALKSPEIAREVGSYVLINTESITVDVHNPDVVLSVEVREKSYIYYENIECDAGLPVGTGGTAAILLSGGIDSPVASYMMSRRGMKMCGIHFHSYPYTSASAKDKVIDLAEHLALYNKGMVVYFVSLTKIQEEIIKNCDNSYLTILLRRFMYRCAESIAKKYEINALVTGESLGQVASQTIESLTCTADAVSMPVLRPLIGIDKNQTIEIAKHIQTYDTSILPYEDCCTIFVPKHPQTRPKLEKVLKEEQKLGVEELIADALIDVEKMVF